ncbi:hypothetical protein AC1031_021342 [Aphanomyces cochlioides]|nr:hypothetical protein AC1031_021342 [Aphanomyces cochlioides]
MEFPAAATSMPRNLLLHLYRRSFFATVALVHVTSSGSAGRIVLTMVHYYLAAFLVATFVQVHGYNIFQRRLPNGHRVPGAPALGHVNSERGGGTLSPFGIDFDDARDSDGDGATNGEELGDPCCVWRMGKPPYRDQATHPGKPDDFTPAQLKRLQCSFAKPRSECKCSGGDCTEGVCTGCNRVDADEGNHCFTDVWRVGCYFWGQPYVWCGEYA